MESDTNYWCRVHEKQRQSMEGGMIIEQKCKDMKIVMEIIG